MSKTRNLLTQLKASIQAHAAATKLLQEKFGKKSQLEHSYRNQKMALDQKFTQQCKVMIAAHIRYLSENDPHGRQPLCGAQAQKILFEKLQYELSELDDSVFIQKLAQEIKILQKNPIMDQPRWSALRINHIMHYFKTLFSNARTRSYYDD